MYALVRQISIRVASRPIVRLLTTTGACATLASCVGNPFADAKVDPNSPLAAEVARVASTNRAWPKFSDIPPTPKDVRQPQQYGRAAEAVEQARSELEAETAPGTWSLTGTDAFAEQARAAAGAESAPQPSSATGDFVDSARRRATPPPPPPQR